MGSERSKNDEGGKATVPAPPSMSFEPPRGRQQDRNPAGLPSVRTADADKAKQVADADEDGLTRPYQAVPVAPLLDDEPGGSPAVPSSTPKATSKELAVASSPLARASAHVAPPGQRPVSAKTPTAKAAGQRPGEYSRTPNDDENEERFDDLRPRRGALPLPSKARPVRPEPSSARLRLPTSLGAAGLPRGMRAPSGIPSETPSEDTDVLIASVAAELIELHPEPEPEPPPIPVAPPPPKPSAPPSTESSVPPLAPSPSATLEDPDEHERRGGVPWLFVGVAAAACVVLALVYARPWTGTRDQPTAAASAAADARVEDNASGDAKLAVAHARRDADGAGDPPEPESPSLIAALDEPKLDVGPPAEAALEGDTDGAEPEEVALDTDVEMIEDAQAEPEAPAGSPAGGGNSPRGQAHQKGSGSSSRPKTSGRQARTPPRPKTSAKQPSAPQSTDPAALLADAKSALSKGNASKAYSLASKSHRKKSSQSALKIMARAACRMGSKSKAKSAFDRLSVGARKGIRSECRDRGVRLGL